MASKLENAFNLITKDMAVNIKKVKLPKAHNAQIWYGHY